MSAHAMSTPQSMHTPASLQITAAEMVQLRRHIHAHPELAFAEHATAELIAGRLADWGIPIQRGFGGTGVVGTIRRGNSTRALGLRADMDALPLQEANRFGHASLHPGVMHACGHDGHTAMLLAAARHLVTDASFDGCVHLIFQPAEEGRGGAKAMVDDGLFDACPMDAVFGMHNMPGLAAGSFAISPGPVMAASAEFRIRVSGKGTHAAMPHIGIDPILIASGIVQAAQGIVSRNKDPMDAAAVSITMIHAGEATNIIPDGCELQGTARALRSEVLDLIEARLRACSEHLALAHGGHAEVLFQRNYPSTVNGVAEAAFVRGVLEELVGPDRVEEQPPAMSSEDFAYMLQHRPGAYCLIGNGEGIHRSGGHGTGPCVLHNPSYDFNDDVIALGATFWVRLVERWLEQTAIQERS